MSPVKKTTEEEVKPKVAKTAAPRVRKPKAVKPAAASGSPVSSAPTKAMTGPAMEAPAVSVSKPVKFPGNKKYFYAVGRRKSAVARVKLMPGKGDFKVNDLELNKYFPTLDLQATALAPLNATNQASSLDAIIKVQGGGKHGQADSVRHGLARALVMMDLEFKPTVKKLGYLTRDARVKERKKYGLKGARRAPQWQKR